MTSSTTHSSTFTIQQIIKSETSSTQYEDVPERLFQDGWYIDRTAKGQYVASNEAACY